MKHLKLISLVLLAVILSGTIFSQSNTCSSLEPICTDVGLDFLAQTGVADASTTDPGNNYGCLLSSPNPTWYYMEVSAAGGIDMDLSAGSDIDYALWGPFTSLLDAQANCDSYGSAIDCSFSAAATENVSVPGAQIGEVYVLLITNYAAVSQQISLIQTGGLGATDCDILDPCSASAGTFTLTVTGGNANIVGNTIFTCEDAISCFDVTSNNDYVLPDPVFLPLEGCSTIPELMYAIYINQAPNSSPADPVNDIGWGGTLWTGQDFNDCDPSLYPPTILPGDVVYLVPITVDDSDDESCGGITPDTDGDGCYAVGETVMIVYLKATTAVVSAVDLCGGTVNVAVNGGMALYNGSDYIITNTGSGTLTGAPITDGGTVVITGLTNGQNWSLSITDLNGCSETINGTYNGTAPLINGTLSVCDGAATSLTGSIPTGGATWLSSNTGVGAVDGNGVVTGVSAGTTDITYTDGNGCQVIETVTVNTLPTVVANATTITLCPGDPVTLTGSGASTYLWDNGVTDGTPFNPSATGNYTVTGTDLSGCENTDNITVTLNTLPTVVANASTITLCPGDPVTLTGSGASTYVWDNGVTDGASFNPSATGNYTVTGTDLSGCENTDNITVTLNTLPTVVADASTITLCIGDPVTLTGSGASTYVWTGGVLDGTSFNPVTTANYIVTGTDVNGCVNADNINVTVDPMPVVNPISPSECENLTGTGQALNINVTGLGTGLNASGTFIWFTDNTYGTPSAPQPTDVTVNNGQAFYFEVTIGACTMQDSVVYSVSGNILVNDPIPEFCEDLAGSEQVLVIDLNTFNNAIFAGATNYTWASGSTNVTINDGDSVNVQVTQGSCPAVEIFVHFIVHPLPAANQATLNACDEGAGQGTFDLTSLNGTVDGGAGNTVVWYTDDLLTVLALPENGFVSGSIILYAQVTNSITNCSDTASISLIVDPLPIANQMNMTACDDGTGQEIFDLTSLNAVVGSGNMVVWYTDAALGALAVPDNAYLTGSTIVYAQVTDATTGCADNAPVTLTVDPLPTAIQVTMNLCDEGGGQAAFDLISLNAIVDGGAGNGVMWYTDDLLTALALPDNAFLTGTSVVYAQVTDLTTGCTDTASVILTVDQLPTAIDQAPSLCEDVLGGGAASGVDLTSLNLSVDGGAGNTMIWYSDATLTTLVIPPTSHTVNNNDLLYVLVDNGTCSDTAMVNYTVTGTIVLVNPNDSLCEDFPGGGSVSGVDLTSYNTTIYSGAATFIWYDDAAMTNAVGTPTNVTISSATNDTLYVDVIEGNCNNSAVVVFTINSLPSAIQTSLYMCDDGSGQAIFDLTALNGTVNGGLGNTVLWYTDATLGTQIVSDNAFLTASATVYAEVIDGLTGCVNNVPITLLINPLPTALSIAMSVCDEGSGEGIFDLTSNNGPVNGGGVDSVLWFANFLDIPSTPINPASSYLTGTTMVYALVIDTTSGCADTVSILLTVNPQSIITPFPDTSICLGDPLTLTATGISSGVITWASDPAGLIVLDTGQTYSPPTGAIGSSTYYVFEDGSCPSAIDTFIVTIGGVTANIDATPTSGAIPLNVTLDGTLSTGAINLWEWDFESDAITDDFNPLTSNTYEDIGVYIVTLTVADTLGCTSAITITIDAFGESTLIVPNIFTPNGDGNNDIFNLSGTNITNIKGTIMNRWGQVVYQFNTLEAGWTGRTVSGIEAMEGTYFYLIDAIGSDGESYSSQGAFELIR